MRYGLVLVVCALLVAGCPGPGEGQPGPDPTPTTTGPVTTGNGTGPTAGSALMALVNGRPIYMEQLHAPLVEAHGLKIAQMLIADRLVELEAGRQRITVTAKDIAAENEYSLRGIFGNQVAPDQRDQVLAKLLHDRGLTRTLWNATMRRNALLRKMVEPHVKVTEEMVRAEFIRIYGDKVVISHIQCPSLQEAEKILGLLEKGQDFAALARRYSTNATTARNDGELPAFTRQDATIPRAMREAAFSLKVGAVSGIVQVGGNFHVLKLRQRMLGDKASYASARDGLSRQLRQRLIERGQADMLAELRRKANVEYVNPILKRATRDTASR